MDAFILRTQFCYISRTVLNESSILIAFYLPAVLTAKVSTIISLSLCQKGRGSHLNEGKMSKIRLWKRVQKHGEITQIRQETICLLLV